MRVGGRGGGECCGGLKTFTAVPYYEEGIRHGEDGLCEKTQAGNEQIDCGLALLVLSSTTSTRYYTLSLRYVITRYHVIHSKS